MKALEHLELLESRVLEALEELRRAREKLAQKEAENQELTGRIQELEEQLARNQGELEQREALQEQVNAFQEEREHVKSWIDEMLQRLESAGITPGE